VSDEGVLYSWGENSFGQCGEISSNSKNDTSMDSEYKSSISSKSSTTSIGHNTQIASVLPSNIFPIPFRISAPDLTFAHVSCGWEHSCAVSTCGKLFAWGRGDSFQLGLGRSTEHRCSPQFVQALSSLRVIQSSCGWQHSAALIDDGQVYVWGTNRHGQLGLGDFIPRMEPTRLQFANETTSTKNNDASTDVSNRVCNRFAQVS
jgi:alpha-tubulin suppressor-like RCC1 family protein